MKTITLLILALLMSNVLQAQVAINSDGAAPNASAMLDIVSTTKGILIPRVASTGDVPTPATGLLVYQTGGTAGFYYYNGSIWALLGGGSGSGPWTTTSNDIYNSNTGGVGIGTGAAPDASAILDLTSTTKGLLVPRMTQAELPSTPVTGLLVYQTDNSPGFYYFDGSTWNAITLSGPAASSGQSGYISGADFTKFNNSLLWGSNVSDPSIIYYTAGRVGVGINPATSVFHVKQDINSSTVFPVAIENAINNTNANGLKIIFGQNTNSAAPKAIGFFKPDGTDIGKIYNNSGTIAIGTSSDSTLKKNICNTRFTIDTLMQIKVRDFYWKVDPLQKLLTGFVAQELYRVYPNAVVRPEDGSNEPWMMSKEELIPLMVKSIQDQQNQIVDLKTQLQTQQTQIDALLQRVQALEAK